MEFPSQIELFRSLAAQALPTTLSTYCFFALSLTQLSVVGHLGVDELAAVAYSQMSMDFSTLVLLHGFVVATNSLCSQAFGARNYPLVSQYGLLTVCVLSALCLPMMILWWNIGDLLLVVGVQEHVAGLAREYARLWILGLWPRTMFQALSMFYQSQQTVLPAATFSCVAVVGNAFLAAGLTHGLFGLPALGFIGCALGTIFIHWFRLIGYFVYMHRIRDPSPPCSWSWDFKGLNMQALRQLLSVGTPLVLGNFFENSQLQVMAIFAATIGEVQLGTHMSMMELIFFTSSPIYGLNDAAVAQIGKHLGANQALRARAVAIVSAKCIAVIQVSSSTVLLVFRSLIGRIFSNEDAVVDGFKHIVSLAACGYAFLAFFSYACLVLEAQTRTTPIMIAFLVGAWGVGVPSAYFFGLKQGHKTLLGIWGGLVTGYLVSASVAFYHAFFGTDWNLEAKLAVQRSQAPTEDLKAENTAGNVYVLMQ